MPVERLRLPGMSVQSGNGRRPARSHSTNGPGAEEGEAQRHEGGRRGELAPGRLGVPDSRRGGANTPG